MWKFKEIPAVPMAACLKVFGPYEKLYQSYIDGIWNQEDPDKWLTIIQVPVEKQ